MAKNILDLPLWVCPRPSTNRPPALKARSCPSAPDRPFSRVQSTYSSSELLGPKRYKRPQYRHHRDARTFCAYRDPFRLRPLVVGAESGGAVPVHEAGAARWTDPEIFPLGIAPSRILGNDEANVHRKNTLARVTLSPPLATLRGVGHLKFFRAVSPTAFRPV